MKRRSLIALGSAITGIFAGILLQKSFFSKRNSYRTVEIQNYKKANFKCKRIESDSRYTLARFWKKEKSIIVLFLCGVISFSWVNDHYGEWLKTSLIGTSNIPFEGTTMPVKKVPKWTDLTSAERTYSYASIPSSKLVELPSYNVSSMRRGSDYNNAAASDINTYVTFSVPYMGNYALDGSEHTGSHPGIDIKLPSGTPVYAIANGVVHKSEYQSGGFGNFITIKHPNVPDPENSGDTANLYSTYAHLTSWEVDAGEEVDKGELIAYSGNSGASTAPHLHFQVDRENAPFIPYWPFSWSDVQSAGYGSYFDGVRYGVGKNKAYSYTVHGVEFINKNKNYSRSNTHASAPKEDEISEVASAQSGTLLIDEIRADEEVRVRGANPKVIKPTAPKKIIKKEEPEEEEVEEKPELNPYTTVSDIPRKSLEDSVPVRRVIEKPKVVIKKKDKRIYFYPTEKGFVPGQKQKVSLNIDDEILVATTDINISSTLKGLAKVEPETIPSSEVEDGTIDVYVTPNSSSDFRIIASGDFGEVKSELMRSQIFSDVSPEDKYYQAIKSLQSKGIIKGYNDGTFKPEETINRAEALKILIEGNKIGTSDRGESFPDVISGAWYEKYIFAGVSYGVVNGYKDGKFYPSKEVTRSEFIKMALLSGDYKIPSSVDSKPYGDVETSAWFAPYMLVARNQNLLPTKKGGLIVAEEFDNQSRSR